ncbi:hypothetical protein [Sphingomonas sp. GC_Shp_3]|uniref:transcription termination/antitermination protein NusG n=1 Tax=Sphingomonas sp. GC_Shp_3 TaxID=2937383 RepID=UPI00226A6FF3|nr:hypothetical protein [Sphingomonas sp. GC_Shp_3]
MRGGNDQEGWCILRTSGPSTMRLTASLQEAGFFAWTPTEHVKRRMPRTKAIEHRLAPLAPTYVFVRGVYLPALQRIERADITPHPRFSIFRHCGAPIFVRHSSLHPLRNLQQQSYASSLPNSGKPPCKDRGLPYKVGDPITFRTGSFTGFTGYVNASDGLTTEVMVTLFGREQGVKVPTLQLRSRNVPAHEDAA